MVGKMNEKMNDVIRLAEDKDIITIKEIADANRSSLGFILEATIEKQVQNKELMVYEHNGEVVGFISFHNRLDGWTTVYELCIEKSQRGKGFGKKLMEVIEEQAYKGGRVGIRLKCPVDLPANDFYAHIGFKKVNIEKGKKRLLNIWEKEINQNESNLQFNLSQIIANSFTFYLTLTHAPWEIKEIMRLWRDSGDNRNPFFHIIFTPLFSSQGTTRMMFGMKSEHNSTIMFDSGGYQVQMGKVSYEELCRELLEFYDKNRWADLYVLPDYVPCSTDGIKEVELKIQKTVEYAQFFLNRMWEGFNERAIGVVHGRTREQVHYCIDTYKALGIKYIGFGSFGTSGPDGGINLISQQSLDLLSYIEWLTYNYGLSLHIFGIGSPSYLIRFIDVGIKPTSFDSAGWYKAGAFGGIFFPWGKQLHITKMDDYNTAIQHEKKRTRHECIFCERPEELRRSRTMRIMHNLTVMMDVIEQIEQKCQSVLYIQQSLFSV